ncbi:hypothetical protein PENANT_c001G01306 [Penicillium antarcticum]|uniref:Uncharacterized protein n=2 Tax=Penicillium antarcticum TaxID=416450 RepID=A0A1V6QME3_9EURO|nr:hypothetical protein PENANT_c001G01306 [Penicillium antarcticum]
MSSNPRPHRNKKNKKKRTSSFSQTENLNITSPTPTKDTDNSQLAAQMASSNELVDQRIESTPLSPVAPSFTPASTLGNIAEDVNVEAALVSGTSSAATPGSPLKTTEYIDLDTPVSSPTSFAASVTDADENNDTRSNVANAGTPVVGAGARAAGTDPAAASSGAAAVDIGLTFGNAGALASSGSAAANADAANVGSTDAYLEDDEYEPPQPGTAYNCAEEQARTTSAVEMFRQIRADRTQVIDVPMTPLGSPVNGNTDFQIWQTSMVLLVRQHGVYGAIDPGIHSLPPGHELYLWYVHMLDIACALIWNNLSAELKANRWLRLLFFQKMPEKLFRVLAISFGEGGDFQDVNTVMGEIDLRHP